MNVCGRQKHNDIAYIGSVKRLNMQEHLAKRCISLNIHNIHVSFEGNVAYHGSIGIFDFIVSFHFTIELYTI